MKSPFERLAVEPESPSSLLYPNTSRILYALSHSFPYSSDGYAVRSHGIAAALVQHGYSVIAVNQPGRPWDFPEFNIADFTSRTEIDGVQYLFLRNPHKRSKTLFEYLSAAIDAYKKVIQVFKPAAIVAASNWESALPAAVAARELGVSFLYEVRGFWEISRAARFPDWRNTDDFKQTVQWETDVAVSANRVITINRLMKEELVRRGVRADRIDLIPNCYGTFPDLSQPPRLSKSDIGCATQYLVGYVGSFSDYEGLDILVRASAQARKSGIDLSLMLLGSSSGITIGQNCPMSAGFRHLAETLEFEDYLILPGRVSTEALADYYSAIDLIVLPRKPYEVCELVSPLKPLEAASHGKAVITSSVGPLKDFIQESGAGDYFESENVAQLTEKVSLFLTNDDMRRNCAAQGRKWVIENREWKANVQPILETIS